MHCGFYFFSKVACGPYCGHCVDTAVRPVVPGKVILWALAAMSWETVVVLRSLEERPVGVLWSFFECVRVLRWREGCTVVIM